MGSINSLRQRANAQNVSFRISLSWPIHIINPVDKTKLSSFSKCETGRVSRLKYRQLLCQSYLIDQRFYRGRLSKFLDLSQQRITVFFAKLFYNSTCEFILGNRKATVTKTIHMHAADGFFFIPYSL